MKVMEELRTRLLKALRAEEEKEAQSLAKSADEALSDAITAYLQASTATPTKPAKKAGKRIKEKGIAITHMEGQGGAANGRNPPLLMKSKNGFSLNINKSALADADPEILAALEKLGYVVGAE